MIESERERGKKPVQTDHRTALKKETEMNPLIHGVFPFNQNIFWQPIHGKFLTFLLWMPLLRKKSKHLMSPLPRGL